MFLPLDLLMKHLFHNRAIFVKIPARDSFFVIGQTTSKTESRNREAEDSTRDRIENRLLIHVPEG